MGAGSSVFDPLGPLREEQVETSRGKAQRFRRRRLCFLALAGAA
jgi:hypothetical protein